MLSCSAPTSGLNLTTTSSKDVCNTTNNTNNTTTNNTTTNNNNNNNTSGLQQDLPDGNANPINNKEACEQRQKKRPRKVAKEVCSDDFTVLQEGHPYGVLPGGNRFFFQDATTTAAKGLRPSDILPNDECWTNILAFCDGPDLARLVMTCRFFYAAGHQPELWRDLTLCQCGALSRSVLSQAGPSWRDTYVKNFYKYSGPHQPMQVPGVYSEYLYRLHSCRSFAIPPQWLDRSSDTVTRVTVAEMTEQRFKDEFEKTNTPVVIEEGAKSWRAIEQWKDPEYCLQHAQGRAFRATSGAAELPADFTLEAYFDYCRSPHLEEAPMYLFDRSALHPGSDMWKDYMADLKRTTPYLDPGRVEQNGHDLFQLLGEGRRPDHTWLIAGPKRSGSVFHIDPNGTHAWNVAVQGRKRWIFFPPGVTPPGVHPSADGDEVALPLTIGEWILSFWDEFLERKRNAPPHEKPLEFTAMPGDVIFVPHGWWHLVLNLDDMNIAVTHNYVSDSNLPNVLKFLERNRDQISGCRDRAESVKPEQLYEVFVDALKEKFPDWLEQALAETKWTCRAWNKGDETDSKEHKKSVMEQAKTESEGFSFSFLSK